MGGFVLLRLRAHRLLVLAAVCTMVLTTAALTALAGYGNAVDDAGIRHALQVADRSATPLLLSEFAPRTQDNGRTTALSAAHRAFPGLPVSLDTLSRSDSLGLPLRPGQAADNADLVTVADLDRSRLRLIAGQWPSGSAVDGVLDAAVPVTAAARFEAANQSAAAAAVGTRVHVTDRFTHGALTLHIVGVYTPTDITDPYWRLDPLGGHGRQAGTAYVSAVYGPLLVDDRAFSAQSVAQSSVAYAALADFRHIRADQLDALARATRGVVGVGPSPGHVGPFSAQSQLQGLISTLQRSMLVARSTLLVVGLQLVLLAAMTLLLAARLLAEERDAENMLLRARGATPRRIIRLAATEGLLLALPGAALAPLLSGPLLRLLGSFGPLHRAGLSLDTGPTATSWAAAAVAALVCALLVTAPTLARYRTFTEARARRGRRGARPELLRGGADLALLALAVLGYLQLRHYADSSSGSGVITDNASGTPGIDPLLVAAPTLALAAGAVLTLRLLPPLSRIGERLATRGRGLPAALTGWQLARRPQRGAGPVLALALAAAIGTLAIGQSATWLRSQDEQADYRTGADLRLTALHTTAFGQGGALASVPGVTRAVPVHRETLVLNNGMLGEMIALDTGALSHELPLRGDLTVSPAKATPEALLAPLASEPVPPAQAGIALPGRPRILSFSVRTRAAVPQGGVPAAPSGQDVSDDFSVQLTDSQGQVWPFPVGSLPEDGAVHTLTLDLAAAAGSGSPAYPLTLSGFGFVVPYTQATGTDPNPAGRAVDASVVAVTADGVATTTPAGLGWHSVADWSAATTDAPDGGPPACTQGTTADGRASGTAPLDVTLTTGVCGAGRTNPSGAPLTVLLLVTPSTTRSVAEPLPAVVDQRFLDATRSRVGSVLNPQASLSGLRIRIVGVVSVLPGVGAEAEQGLNGSTLDSGTAFGGSNPTDYGGAILIDLPSYAWYFTGNAAGDRTDPPRPNEWWLTTAPGTERQAAAVLRARPDIGLVFGRTETADSLRQDPLGSGPLAAMFAAVALAVALSAIGFGTDAAGAIRQRAGEFAVLSALGLRRRRLARSTAVELVIPVVLGLGVGVALGEVLTRLIVPLLVLTSEADRPTPPVQVDIPVGTLLLLLAGIAAVPVLVAAFAGFRGGDTARRLRQPEES
ncbi:FtsX-like permease family protein [Streptacidiphilus rugosus]|uniref:FtsX-like permease family protein n=1 Tax=Streptacidiphilus rugosus TaxID=405783 RepID=UPI0005624FE6|nr:FtsX-like permease family protein [Streptacidiphilus rugosus]